MKNRLEYVVSFLNSHGWIETSATKYFFIYSPPEQLNLPKDYYLEIPKQEADKGFQRYINELVPVIEDIYGNIYSSEDVASFFTTQNHIFALQIVDNDTKLGTIKLARLKNAFNNIYNSIKQTVIFSVTNMQIFGNAKYEIAQYLNVCRGRQTEFGSYVVKFELPENHLTLLGERSVPNLLFDSIHFLTEISDKHQISEIDYDFIEGYSDYINIELFESIIKLHKEAELNDINIFLSSNSIHKAESFKNIRNNLPKIEQTVRAIKDLILQDVSLETRGYIFRLTSKDPSEKGKVWIEADIADEKQIIEVLLSGEAYSKAVDAHIKGQEIYVKGIAQQGKSRYFIEKIEEFKTI